MFGNSIIQYVLLKIKSARTRKKKNLCKAFIRGYNKCKEKLFTDTIFEVKNFRMVIIDTSRGGQKTDNPTQLI